MQGIPWLSRSYSITIIRFYVPIPTILSALLMLLSISYRTFSLPYGTDERSLTVIEKVSSFLFVSARNACLNHSKHEQMKAAKLKEFVAQTDEAVYDDYIIMAEFDQKLNHWLESLPTECRKIIDMSVSGMKNDEIAKALNISVNTVKNQKVKGFKILKELYKDEYLTILFYIFIALSAK